MKRDRIIRELNALAKTEIPRNVNQLGLLNYRWIMREEAAEKLLELIDDPQVTRAFNKVRRWGQ